MGSGKRGRVKDVDTAKAKQEEEKKKEDKLKAEKKAVPRAIVRVAGTDLNGEKQIVHAIKWIKGIGHTFAVASCYAAGLPLHEKLSSLSESQIQKLEEVVRNPTKFGIPTFLINRRKEPATGQNVHLIGQDLTVQQKFDVQREIDLKTYKGFRHMLGQPVRGQRTRAHFRGKGRVVGVMRKAVQAQMGKTGEGAKTGEKAAAAAPAAKKEEAK